MSTKEIKRYRTEKRLNHLKVFPRCRPARELGEAKIEVTRQGDGLAAALLFG